MYLYQVAFYVDRLYDLVTAMILRNISDCISGEKCILAMNYMQNNMLRLYTFAVSSVNKGTLATILPGIICKCIKVFNGGILRVSIAYIVSVYWPILE